MRTVSIRKTTFGGGKSKRKLSIKSFVLLRKNVFSSTFLPPLRLFNQFLLQGNSQADSGDVIEWEPFKISSDEYADLAQALGEDYVCKSPPKGIKTLDEWADYAFKVKYPAKPAKK